MEGSSFLGVLNLINNYYYVTAGNISHYKVHLKSCMKITSGTGDIGTPYILENKC